MQTRFILSNGRSVYAPYLSDYDRMVLKNELKKGELKLYCGCSKDVPLYYGVSSDLRIIPLHKHYEHKPWCSRFDSDNRASATVYDGEGNVTLYVSFNPNTFTLSMKAREEELLEESYGTSSVVVEDDFDAVVDIDTEIEKKESLPSFNLYNMVRFLNHDTYMNRVASGKYPYLSEEYFFSAFNSHLKTVRISGMKKPLRELSFKDDKMKFFYVKVSDITEKSITYPSFEGRMVHRFVPLNVMAKAEDAFEKKYGLTIQEYMSCGTVLAAGFQYQRLNRRGEAYKCVGRMVFFPVTEHQLFVDSLTELDIVNLLMKVCKKHNCLFLYSEDDKGSIVGIIRNNKTGKEAPVFYNRRAKGYEGEFFSCKGVVPCGEEIEAFLPFLA